MLIKRDYKKLIGSLTERLLVEFEDKIHSVILFGSAARKETRDDSDVDVLIIADVDFDAKQRMYEMSYDVDLTNEIFTQTILFTLNGFEKEVAMRSYFIENVLNEGVVIYDDGTYQGIRNKEPLTFSGIPRR